MKFFIICVFCLSLMGCNQRRHRPTTPEPTPSPDSSGLADTSGETSTSGETGTSGQTATSGQTDTSGETGTSGQTATPNSTSPQTVADLLAMAPLSGKADTPVSDKADTPEEAGTFGETIPAEGVENFVLPTEGTYCSLCKPPIIPAPATRTTTQLHETLLDRPQVEDIPGLVKLEPAMPKQNHIETYLPSLFPQSDEGDNSIEILKTLYVCVGLDPMYTAQYELYEYYGAYRPRSFHCDVERTYLATGGEMVEDPASKSPVIIFSMEHPLDCREPLKKVFAIEESLYRKCMTLRMHISFPNDNHYTEIYQ